jgi:hypothetical protein
VSGQVTEQVAALINNATMMLPPVATGAAANTYDDIRTRYSMYVPRIYLPLVLARCMTPKEALLSINTEAVTQNEQDLLKALINWLRVAVTYYHCGRCRLFRGGMHATSHHTPGCY